MTAHSRIEQLAILLHLMGEDVARAAIGSLEGDVATVVRDTMSDFEVEPPSREAVSNVLDTFDRYIRIAMADLERQTQADLEEERDDTHAASDDAEEPFIVEFKPSRRFAKVPPTGDLKMDLNRLHPYQVAEALKEDTPKTIALVIKNLASEHGAKTLELLPAELQSRVFLELSSNNAVAPGITQSVLQAALEAARRIEERRVEVTAAERMLGVVRSVPRDVRTRLLNDLLETNEELAQEIKSQLYCFDDIERLGDRDIQSVLSQCDSDALIMALQNVNDALLERILGNMSKRAAQTIREEMEFKADSKQEDIDAARSQIVEVLIRMEENGEISFE